MKESEITYKQFEEALKIVHEYMEQVEHQYKTTKNLVKQIPDFSRIHKETLLYDADISVRLHNILMANAEKLGFKMNWETKIGDLSSISLSKFRKCRFAGPQAVKELRKLCAYANIELSP